MESSPRSGDVLTTGEEPPAIGWGAWAGRSFSGPMNNATRVLKNVNFTPVVPRRAWCYSSVQEWSIIMRRVVDYYGSRIRPDLARNDPALAAVEDEQLEKAMVNWRVPGYGRMLYTADFVSRSKSQADELRPFLRKRGLEYEAFLMRQGYDVVADVYNKGSIRLDKGKGAPWWFSGADRGAGLLLSLLSMKLPPSELSDLLTEHSGGVRMAQTMYLRMQANRKEVPLITESGGKLFYSGTWKAAKVRTIKAPPLAFNARVAGYADVHKWAAVSIWSDRHVTELNKISELAGKWPVAFGSDLSTLDDTVSLDTLEVLDEEILDRIRRCLCELGVISMDDWTALRQYDAMVRVSDILAPARTKNEQACYIRLEGGVKSGERTTTVKDLDVVAARDDAKLANLRAAGFESNYLSWGDDTLVLAKDSRAADSWDKDPSQRHLFKEKIEAFPTFLMRKQPAGHGFIMRYVARRINREPSEEPDTDLLAAVSIRASMVGLKGVRAPHPSFDHYLPMLESCVPKLKAACSLARSLDLKTLLDLYTKSGGSDERLAGLTRGERMEDDLSDLLTANYLAGFVHDEDLNMDVKAMMSIGEMKREADKWSKEDLLRVLKTKAGRRRSR